MSLGDKSHLIMAGGVRQLGQWKGGVSNLELLSFREHHCRSHGHLLRKAQLVILKYGGVGKMENSASIFER